MIRSSNQRRAELVAAFARAMPELQDATDAVDEAAAEILGTNRTDLRVLGVLVRRGPTPPSALADATGLSRGAMTTALDRLEAAGYVRRVPDPEDRRSVRVETTAEATRAIEAIWGPIAREGAAAFDGYSTDELAAILRFLDEARAVQERHADRIRGMAKKKRKPR